VAKKIKPLFERNESKGQNLFNGIVEALGFSDLFRCDPLRNEVSVFNCVRQLRL